MIKTYTADCIEVMKDMPDNSVDSIVTDPPYELGFMGKSWDASGIAFNMAVWQQALRVLKPGGHLLAFSGSRTYHRMAVAIEDAGFEIRDQIMWVYGTGFPKSMNIAKAIDKNAGAPVKVGKAFKVAGEYGGRNLRDSEPQGPDRDAMRHSAVTEQAKEWEGWGTALKPAHEPIVLARKPLIGTVAANVLAYGTGGLNIDANRIDFASKADKKESTGKNQHADFETKPLTNNNIYGDRSMVQPKNYNATGRWPTNFIHDGSQEVLDLFPELSKFTGSASAARFFYCAKASKKDRNEGLDRFITKQATGGGGGVGDYLDDVNSASGKYGSEKAPQKNHHPTVKPTELMRYLCRLITPPGGVVLDPFMGSGSTGKAAVYEGFSFIGVDQSEEYVKLANARIEFALKGGK